ncbi:unnamed protein product, partial [Coregonus sp. 'balchen']
METRGTSSSGEGVLSRMALNDNKAGMEGLDRDKINKIIMKSSKGSRFYENEMKKEQQVNQRIERMMLQKAHITEQQLSKAQTQVEKMTFDLERVRDLSHVIVHVDMDAFYAAVETRDCPDLKDKPMAREVHICRSFTYQLVYGLLSGSEKCPVIALQQLSHIEPQTTSNYHARKFGVRAAMPGFIAKKLCPNLVIVPTNFDKYRAVSAEVREIFADYDPHFLPMSLDEAYLDISEHLEQRRVWPEALRTHRLRTKNTGTATDVVVFGTCAEEAVREMRFRIEQKTSLTASAGIAPNMMLAKVCSDKNKPNGQYRLPSNRQAVMVFIQDLPVRKVSGIGKVTEKMLGALGITSCVHLGQEMSLLALLFSETSWHHFLHISLGLGSTHIERTFGEMSALEEQFSLCRQLLTLKLKNVNFEVKTRAWTLPCAVATTDELFAVAKDLLKTEIDNVSPQPLRLRLMGVRVSSFVSADDKKPLQKSIVGFLQQGGADSSSPSQMSSHKPVKEHQPKPPGQTQPFPCPFLLQQSQGQEDHPWVPSWGGVEVGRTGEQQQSFFQRAHTQRLRLQAERADPSEDGKWNGLETRLGPTSSATNPKERHPQTPTQKNPNTSAETHFSMSAFTASDNMIHAPTANTTEAHVSTSSCWSTESGTGSLTCPVCFREVNTTDLTVFNRHIDQCLSGVPMEHNIHTDTELERGSSVCEEEVEKEREEEVEKEMAEEGRRWEEGVIEKGRDPLSMCMLDSLGLRLDSSAGDHTGLLLYETSTTNISLNTVGLNPVCLNTCPNGGVSIPRGTDPNILKGSSQSDSRVRPLSPGGPRPMATPKPESHDPRDPALTCPVCQVTQDTDDLTLFNQHVDLCLNQEILHELGGLASVDRTTHNATPAAHKEREQPLQRAPQKGKSKRRGSSPQPPSKKAKALGPARNTIDKFF